MIWQIRTYRAADREACCRIFDSNMPVFFDPSERNGLLNWLDARDQERAAYASNRVETFYVLEIDGEVLGCAGFYIPGSEKCVNMVWGMVENAWHKKGLGRGLLEYRIRLAQTCYPDCSISLDTTQHSYGFFERLGFTVTAITNNYYGPGLNRYDMLLKGGQWPPEV